MVSKYPGESGVHERLHVLAIFSLVPFDRHAGIPLSSMEQRNGRIARGFDARHGSDLLYQVSYRNCFTCGLV